MNDSLEWSRDYWNSWAGNPGLRAVLDPNDAKGEKNEKLDQLAQDQLRLVLDRNHIRSMKHVLDFGCGIGRNYDLLCRTAANYTGVDISDAMVRRHGKNAVVYDGKTLPFAHGSFDLLVAMWALQHIVEDEPLVQVAREIRRVLVPGAWMVICNRAAHVPKEAGRPDGFIQHRPPQYYQDLFAPHGLKLIDTHRFRLRIPRPGDQDDPAIGEFLCAYRLMK